MCVPRVKNCFWMKRPRSPDTDPVLAQLAALINPQLPTPDPVLAQLDALINGGAGAPCVSAAGAPPLPPLLAPPSLLEPPQTEPLLPLTSPAWRHAGLFREVGGVKAWMRSQRAAETEPQDGAGARA